MRALLFALEERWVSPTRLPKILRAAGFEVAVAATRRTRLNQSAFINERFAIEQPLSCSRWLLKQIERWRPDIVIPADEKALRMLRFLAAGHCWVAGRRTKARTLIDCSLGAARFRHAWGRREEVQQIARACGVRVPPSAPVATLDDAMIFVGRHGYPAVVKSDDTYAGGAVRICRDELQLRRAVEALLMRPPSKPARGERIRRMLDRALGEFVDEKSLRLSIQGFVSGIPVHRCFVAYRGQVWAGVTAIKEQVFPPVTGPSTVVRLTDIPEIALAVETFAAHVGYSGVGSMDFMLDEDGKPYAVEFNPRPAPLFRVGIHAGIDLAAALHDAFSGGTPAAPAPLASELVIPLFPEELMRDPTGAAFLECDLDVPFDEPQLMQALIALASAMNERRQARSGAQPEAGA